MLESAFFLGEFFVCLMIKKLQWDSHIRFQWKKNEGATNVARFWEKKFQNKNIQKKKFLIL
jgi:glycerol-3-phosphate acyltransferase PlsY